MLALKYKILPVAFFAMTFLVGETSFAQETPAATEPITGAPLTSPEKPADALPETSIPTATASTSPTTGTTADTVTDTTATPSETLSPSPSVEKMTTAPSTPTLPQDITITFPSPSLNDTQKQQQQALRFGTLEQLNGVITALKANNDTALNNELFLLLRDNKNLNLRKQILQFFTDEKEEKILPYVVSSLQQYVDPSSDLYQYSDVNSLPAATAISQMLTAEIAYLRETEAQGYADLLFEIAETQPPSSVTEEIFRALMTLGDKSYTQRALDILNNNIDWDDKYIDTKGQIILTLGAWKAYDAVYDIEAILQDESAPNIQRWYAAEALGQIQDPNSLEILEAVYNITEKNPTFSTYLLSGIGYYDTDDANQILIEGLRNSNENVRETAIKRLQDKKSATAFEAIFYVVRYDTSPKVRLAALEGLGGYPATKETTEFLTTIVDDTTKTAASRIPAFDALLASAPKVAVDSIETLFLEDPEILIPYDRNNQDRLIDHVLQKIDDESDISAYKTIISKSLSYPNFNIQRRAITIIAGHSSAGFTEELNTLIESETTSDTLKNAAKEAL